jgi:hypothetical protein
VTATATTTIQGVSVLSRQKKRGGTDRFELALSPTGIEVRRPGRPVQQLGWDRVSEWEIEERKGYLLLTLRGRGATTPLVVPGWTLDDLELLMREITADPTTGTQNGAGPVVTKPNVAAATATAAAAAAPTVATPAPTPAPTPTPAPAAAAPPSRAERRQWAPRPERKRRQFQLGWKPVVTVVLLGVLAAAITLVLLQSAGVINWSFLGPVA